MPWERVYRIDAIIGITAAIVTVAGSLIGWAEGVPWTFRIPVIVWTILGVVILWDRYGARMLSHVRGEAGPPANARTTEKQPPVESASQQPQPPENVAGIICVDIRADTSRIQKPSPWLDFHCVGFNGSPSRIFLKSAQGRIKFSGVEFHEGLELESDQDSIEPFSLFEFSLHLRVSSNEAALFINAATENYFVVGFKNAEITGATEAGTAFAMPALPEVQFSRRHGQASSSYVLQVLNR
jgi:hypothetical protein